VQAAACSRSIDGVQVLLWLVGGVSLFSWKLFWVARGLVWHLSDAVLQVSEIFFTKALETFVFFRLV
jgi:hypothetical protein